MKAIILIIMLTLVGCNEKKVDSFYDWVHMDIYLDQIELIEEKYADEDCQEIFAGDSRVSGGEWEQFGICNYGIGGDMAYGVLNRLDYIIAKQPYVVYVQVGRNDLVVSPHRLQDTFMYYEEIVTTLESQGIEVITTTTLPDHETHRAANALILALNEMLVEFSPVNLNALYPDGYLINHYDGIHLNEIGYNIWYEILFQVEQPDIEQQSGVPARVFSFSEVELSSEDEVIILREKLLQIEALVLEYNIPPDACDLVEPRLF